MEAKNIQIIRRTYQILKTLECPLLSPDESSPPLNEDEQLYFCQTSSQQYAAIRQFIQPGENRLSLFMWLIQIFDCSLLESCKGKKQAEKIEEGLRLMGLLPWHTVIQNQKTVQGFNGLSASLNLLYKACELVFQDTIKTGQSASTLLKEIAQNSSKIFPARARLYPPDFPASLQMQKAATLSQLSEAVKDWEKVKEQTLQELNELLEGYYVQNQELVRYDTLVSLKQSLLHLRQQATHLISALNDIPMQGKLKKAENDLSHLAQLIQNCSMLNQKVEKTVAVSDSILQNIHLIVADSNTNVKLPSIGEIKEIKEQISLLDTLSKIY